MKAYKAINGNSIRSHVALSDEQIRTVAPSIFTIDKHEERSARYAVIPTIDVMRGMQKEGFQPFMVAQQRVRDEGKREYARHMIRMRHQSHIGLADNAGIANEIILLNSHDGTSSYQLLAGVFRFVCQNGMIAGDIQTNQKVRHSGNVVHNVIEGAYTVLDSFAEVDGARERMQALQLPVPAMGALANAALAYKFGTEPVNPDEPEGPQRSLSPITADQLLHPRRWEDRGSDLWRTFNRVQENLVRGGLRHRERSETGRRGSTRAVTGIDADIKLNRALWVMADQMADLLQTRAA